MPDCGSPILKALFRDAEDAIRVLRAFGINETCDPPFHFYVRHPDMLNEAPAAQFMVEAALVYLQNEWDYGGLIAET